MNPSKPFLCLKILYNLNNCWPKFVKFDFYMNISFRDGGSNTSIFSPHYLLCMTYTHVLFVRLKINFLQEKPHMFQFVPNEKQVCAKISQPTYNLSMPLEIILFPFQVHAANKLLKSLPQRGRRKKLDGVPVFSAQNLNIAVATNDGIRWYGSSWYLFDYFCKYFTSSVLIFYWYIKDVWLSFVVFYAFMYIVFPMISTQHDQTSFED